MLKFLNRFAADEAGATSIEYAFIAAMIGMAIISSVTGIGNGLNGVFGNAAGPL